MIISSEHAGEAEWKEAGRSGGHESAHNDQHWATAAQAAAAKKIME
jgi:hypothetical protein